MPQQPLLSSVEESKVRRLAQEPKQARSLTKLLEAIGRRAIEAALRSKQVSDRLSGTRHEVVAIDIPAFEPAPAAKRAAGDGKQTSPMAEVGVYDYDYNRNVLVVPIVDLRSCIVRKIDERRGLQPALCLRGAWGAQAPAPSLTPNRHRFVGVPDPRHTFGPCGEAS